jgi:hypothetical protein
LRRLARIARVRIPRERPADERDRNVIGPQTRIVLLVAECYAWGIVAQIAFGIVFFSPHFCGVVTCGDWRP